MALPVTGDEVRVLGVQYARCGRGSDAEDSSAAVR